MTHLTSSHSQCRKEEKQDFLRFSVKKKFPLCHRHQRHPFSKTTNQYQSQGEERSTSDGFEISPMKKAASMAHVDTSPRGKTRSASIMIINKLAVAGTSLPVPRISFLDVLPCRPDPSLMGDKFEGRMLLHLFASCFTEDSYLRVQLTSQVSLHKV